MGTNFFWRDPAVGPNDLHPPENHLGKRSAAGYWFQLVKKRAVIRLLEVSDGRE